MSRAIGSKHDGIDGAGRAASLLRQHGRRTSPLVVLAVFALLALPSGVSAQPTPEYAIRETIAIPPSQVPSGVVSVNHVGDMDGDGVLDIVLIDHGTTGSPSGTIRVLERDGATFVERFSYSTGDYYTGARVADVDGDGVPEIASKTSFVGGQFRVHEATGDNAYAQTFAATLGVFLENVTDGDSDGDGAREWLIARESFPSDIYRYEATADNVYTALAGLSHPGGDSFVAGTADLDGDGLVETVFSDNFCHAPPCIGQYSWAMSNLYVYENGALVYEDPARLMFSSSLGDTDGNGLGEIIGRETVISPVMRILESTGSANDFVEVYSGNEGYSPVAIDVDADGVSELWRALDDGSGQNRILALAHRSGGTITDFYDSGTLLQDLPGDIWNVLAIGDTNGDGGLELAVIQEDDQIRILEAAAATAVPTSTGECKQGGWQTLTDDQGNGFKNQGDCVSYVATKGKNKGAVAP